MPKFCAVFNCSNRSSREKDKKFYRFPTIQDRRGNYISEGRKRRDLWLRILKRKDLTEDKVQYSYVCSDHFVSGKPVDSPSHQDYVPSQNLGYATCSNEMSNRAARYYQKQKSNDVVDHLELENEMVGENIHCEIILPSPEELIQQKCDKATQSEAQKCDKATQTETVTDTVLNEELYKLRERIRKSSFDEESFRDNDKKSRYFTGLPTFTAVIQVFSLMQPFINITPKSSIQDKFIHFIIVLMKLRLNLDFTMLAYLFQVSENTVSRIFYSVLDILFYRLKNFIIWPTRDELIRTMPECFQLHFNKKVCVIIDCFEIRIQKAANLDAQASTWSNYKHFNTIKVLIGITPQGSVSYISQGYGGRISDKALTEDCGILENLLPGDVVLADRGFLIEELVGLYMATVKTPAFLKQKRQLEPQEIEHTRHVAAVRIHVERVIGSLRMKFAILSDILPITMLKRKQGPHNVLDQILVVTSALVNLCPSIVNE